MPEPMTTALTLHAPAKINLYLKVLDKRPDGYHNLLSLMQMVGLYDRLTFAPTSGGITLGVCGAPLPADRTNLVFRAADLLRRAAEREGRTPGGVAITLVKEIPVAAGLGGGSSDAAATLIALNRIWSLGWPRKRLAALGGTIGSDLPFFFYGPTAWVSGRGEIVESVPPVFVGWVLLVHPDLPVSTAHAYAALSARRRLTKTARLPKINPPDAVRPSAEAVLGDPCNHLEEVTCDAFPLLNAIKAALRKEGGKGVLMSGSGPTLFARFENRRQGEQASERIARRLGLRVSLSAVLQHSPLSGK